MTLLHINSECIVEITNIHTYVDEYSHIYLVILVLLSLNQIIHGNLKPGNILINSDQDVPGGCKLIACIAGFSYHNEGDDHRVQNQTCQLQSTFFPLPTLLQEAPVAQAMRTSHI